MEWLEIAGLGMRVLPDLNEEKVLLLDDCLLQSAEHDTRSEVAFSKTLHIKFR